MTLLRGKWTLGRDFKVVFVGIPHTVYKRNIFTQGIKGHCLNKEPLPFLVWVNLTFLPYGFWMKVQFYFNQLHVRHLKDICSDSIFRQHNQQLCHRLIVFLWTIF